MQEMICGTDTIRFRIKSIEDGEKVILQKTDLNHKVNTKTNILNDMIYCMQKIPGAEDVESIVLKKACVCEDIHDDTIAEFYEDGVEITNWQRFYYADKIYPHFCCSTYQYKKTPNGYKFMPGKLHKTNICYDGHDKAQMKVVVALADWIFRFSQKPWHWFITEVTFKC